MMLKVSIVKDQPTSAHKLQFHVWRYNYKLLPS